jgi:hypothetical protein
MSRRRKLASEIAPLTWRATPEDRRRIKVLKRAKRMKSVSKTLSLAVTAALELYGLSERDAA